MRTNFFAAMLAVTAFSFARGEAIADGHNPDPVEQALLKIEAGLVGALIEKK